MALRRYHHADPTDDGSASGATLPGHGIVALRTPLNRQTSRVGPVPPDVTTRATPSSSATSRVDPMMPNPQQMTDMGAESQIDSQHEQDTNYLQGRRFRHHQPVAITITVAPETTGSPGEGGHGGGAPSHYSTPLTATEERAFQQWKQIHAPNDDGSDYDFRGAFKAGLNPDPQTGHWPDTFKKPNEPTFSDQSQYARDVPGAAGRWSGDNFVPPANRRITRQGAAR